jgi:hypothetical protein
VPIGADRPWVWEIFAEYNEADPSKSSFMMWEALEGDAPKLTRDARGITPFGSSSNHWFEMEAMYHSTGAGDEPGRPDMYWYVLDWVTSTKPIPFPGGYALPNAPEP